MEFIFRKQTYAIKIHKGFFLLCLILFILCNFLGVWQFQRYQYKKTLLLTFQQRLAALPVPFSDLPPRKEDTQFLPVQAEGHYINELTILVQNKLYKGQLGFEVMTPLRMLGDPKLLLVDRGWVKKDHNASLPYIDPVIGNQKMIGKIKWLDENPFILGENVLEPHKRPLMMQRIELQELSQITGHTFYPFVLRLDAAQSHGFTRDWVITSISPERHLGYTIQWFIMAIVLVIAYLCFTIERVGERKKC